MKSSAKLGFPNSNGGRTTDGALLRSAMLSARGLAHLSATGPAGMNADRR